MYKDEDIADFNQGGNISAKQWYFICCKAHAQCTTFSIIRSESEYLRLTARKFLRMHKTKSVLFYPQNWWHLSFSHYWHSTFHIWVLIFYPIQNTRVFAYKSLISQNNPSFVLTIKVTTTFNLSVLLSCWPLIRISNSQTLNIMYIEVWPKTFALQNPNI